MLARSHALPCVAPRRPRRAAAPPADWVHSAAMLTVRAQP